MKKILATVALFFALASTSAFANDYKCDKKFIFFPGGPEGGPFGTIVYNGAVAAAEHTGCKVDYYWSQWNSEIMIKQLWILAPCTVNLRIRYVKVVHSQTVVLLLKKN